LDKGLANIRAVNNINQTALHVCCKKGNLRVLRLLLDKLKSGDALLTMRDNSYRTPLHVYVRRLVSKQSVSVEETSLLHLLYDKQAYLNPPLMIVATNLTPPIESTSPSVFVANTNWRNVKV
jgi:ankyrin repeat protein